MTQALSNSNHIAAGATLMIASPGLQPGDPLEIEFPDQRRVPAKVTEAHNGRLTVRLDGHLLTLRTFMGDDDDRDAYAPAMTQWRIDRVEPV